MEMTPKEEYAGFSSTESTMANPITVGIVGIGAVALAILGLAKVFPQMLASVAVIAVGIGLAFEGGAISARYAFLIGEGVKSEAIRVGGITSLFVAGAAGIALGILALVGVYPTTLIPVAAVVFGAAIILDSGTNERLSILELHHRAGERSTIGEGVVRQAAQSSASLQVLAGAGAVVLGILGLIHIVPIVLSLIAFLSIGAVNLLSSPMISSRMSELVGVR